MASIGGTTDISDLLRGTHLFAELGAQELTDLCNQLRIVEVTA